MVSLGISANDFDMEELPMELMVGGNTLITEFGGNQTRQDGRVIEVDSAGSIVWEKAGLNMPMDAERLSNGNTLITIYGDQLVIEVDSAGSIVWQKNNLTEPMDAERLSNGNTLIAEFGGDRVIEVDSAGSIVWEKAGLSSPFDVERFSNGNTLIVEANVVDGRVIEVDSAGSIVWEKTGLTGPIDAERLSNGNTLITEHIGKKIIEVDSAGNEVWNMTELHYPVDAKRLSNPPDAPEITGETNGKKGTEYEYSFTSTDPEGDDIEAYIVNWDDDGDETITGPFASGATAKASHTWDEAGTYIISATAIDVNGAQSDPGTLEVTMPRNKAFNFNFNLLEQLFDRFPNMFPVLRYLLGI